MTTSTHRRHGFSTLEVVLALSVFLVVAAGLASAATRMASSAVRTEARAAAAAMLERQLDALESRPFDSLLGAFDAPDPCGEPGTADGRVSCVEIGSTTYRVEYSVAAGEDPAVGPGRSASAVTVTASTRTADGTNLTARRVIAAPQVGGDGDSAVLRITATSESNAPSVNIMDASGDIVLDGVPFEGNVAVARIPGGDCGVAAGGCRVALSADPANWWRSGDLTLSANQITAEPMVLSAGTLTDTAIDISSVATAKIRVLAQPSGSGPRTGAPASTVCVWVSFDDGTSTRAVPYCNTEDGGDTIPIETWPVAGDGTPRPFSDEMSLRLHVEKPGSATCPVGAEYPYGAPLGASNGGGWGAADVCATWTWGIPSLFGSTGDSPGPTVEGAELQPRAGGASYDLIYTESSGGAAIGRPATGAGAVGVWSKPRTAALASPAGCATDADAGTLCVNSTAAINTPTPETAVGAPGSCASNQFCFATNNVAPRLTAPGGTAAVYTPVSDTPFEVRATDPEGDAISLRVAESFGLGSARIFDDVSGTPVGTGAVTPVSPGVWRLRYNWAPERPEGGWGPITERIAVELSDDGGVSWDPHVISFYSENQPLRIDLRPLEVSQSETAATYRARVVDTEGAGVDAHTLVLASTGVGANLVDEDVTAVTGADGVATFTFDASESPAGTVGLRVYSQSHPAVASDGTATVTAAAGSVTVDAAASANQGAQLAVTAGATDTTGAPLQGATITLEGRRGGASTNKVRAPAGGCVTGPAGTCATSVRIAADTPSGPHSVRAAVDGVSASDDFEVVGVVSGITAGTGTTGSGGYTEAVSVDSPYSHWPLDETAGTLTDRVAGRDMTTSGQPRRGAAALAGEGGSIGFDADGAKACSPALTLPTSGATIEAWVNLSTHKPLGAQFSEIAGIRTGGSQFALTAGNEADQTLPTLWLANGATTRKVTGSAPLQVGRNHHLVGTYAHDVGTNTTTARLYVDGRIAGTTSFAGTVTASGAVCAGAFSSPIANMSLHGEVDEVAVYTSALPVAAIERHFGAGGIDGAAGSITVPQSAASQLAISVTDGAGAAMSEQNVTVTSNTAGIGVGATTVSTGASGVATVGVTAAANLAAGTYPNAITVAAGGRTLSVTVAVAAVVDDIEFDAASVTIGGRGTMAATITDTAGDPVAGIRVAFSSVGAVDDAVRFSSSATTDGDGVARVVITPARGADPSTVQLRARAGALSATADLTIVDGASLERSSGAARPVRIPSGGSGEWAYQVVDSNGDPVTDADVTISCSGCGLGFSPATMYTGSDGWARTTVTDTGGPNPVGTYRVSVDIAGQVVSSTITVTASAGDIEADTAARRVRAGESVTYRVRVIGDCEQGGGGGTETCGVPGVAVTADGTPPAGITVSPARTGATGYATITVAAGDTPGSHAVPITAGGAGANLNLVVEP